MKKIYFASDTHFGSRTFDDPLENERRFVRWLDSIKHDAAAVYLVGDMIDFWYEFKYVVPKGFTRFLGKLGELTDSGIEVHWFIGNHDIWIFDYIGKETGAIIHREPLCCNLLGKSFYIAHGDGLGDNSLGFKFIRSIFHNKILQKMFTWIHPRWTIPFGLNWSKHSRKTGDDYAGYLGEEKEHLVLYAKEFLQKNQADFLVFGHRHIMLDLMLAQRSRIIILGDWIKYFSYAVFDGEYMWLDQFETE